MSADGRPASLRQRRRAELVEQVIETARRHLVTEGAAGLSLRAVAREIGIAPSALYRYFPSRDDLLTALIVLTYEEINRVTEEAVTAALARHPTDHVAAWVDATVGYRAWALAHHAEFALVYGTPVPGYRAPEDATRALGQQAGAAFGRILAAAVDAGTFDTARVARIQAGMSPGMRERMTALASERGVSTGGESAGAALTVGLGAWAKLQGLVAMELFGHVPPDFPDAEEHFRIESAALAERLVRPTGGPG